MKHDVYDNETATGTAARRTAVPPSAEDKQEMMKRAETLGAPGPGHKALEHFVGTWKCEVKCWMDPAGPPEQSQATAEVRWTMNGRYLQEDFRGQMMGRPFNGRFILGHNNIKQTYQSVWIDDMNTAMFVSEGKGDSKTITLEGKSSCPGTGRADVPMKAVLRVLTQDRHTFEMFDGSQNNARTMEITYTRD